MIWAHISHAYYFASLDSNIRIYSYIYLLVTTVCTTANKIVDKYMYISIENVNFLPQNYVV